MTSFLCYSYNTIVNDYVLFMRYTWHKSHGVYRYVQLSLMTSLTTTLDHIQFTIIIPNSLPWLIMT